MLVRVRGLDSHECILYSRRRADVLANETGDILANDPSGAHGEDHVCGRANPLASPGAGGLRAHEIENGRADGIDARPVFHPVETQDDYHKSQVLSCLVALAIVTSYSVSDVRMHQPENEPVAEPGSQRVIEDELGLALASHKWCNPPTRTAIPAED